MRSKAKQAGECRMQFEIEIESGTISKAFDEVYAEITKISNIPGFRPGRAPLELVKKHHSKDAKDEVLKRLIPQAYAQALKEHGVNPIGMPEVSDLNFEEEKRLAFTVSVDTRPDFKIKNYKALKVEKKKASISDEDVRKTLDELAAMNARYVPAPDRPVQDGDYVVSDLDCTVDGKPAHKKRENLWLYMEKGSVLPGLYEGMVGMNKGEAKEIESVMPDKYTDKNLAGKKALYHVMAKEIRVRNLPKIDDEFAKDLGKENLEDLKKEILKELEARADLNSQVDMENRILTMLAEENVFSVPASFVARQLDFMVDNAKERLVTKGFKKEELDKKDKDFRDKFKADALKQVRLLFILDEIARSEHIEVTDEDVEKAYASIAAQSGKSAPDVRQHYEKEGLEDNLKEKLREGKVIQFIVKNAVITEKQS